jgi:hypothetical protein
VCGCDRIPQHQQLSLGDVANRIHSSAPQAMVVRSPDADRVRVVIRALRGLPPILLRQEVLGDVDRRRRCCGNPRRSTTALR